MSAVCVIPARGGSQRIPGKNIRPFFGKPILAYSIELARQSRLFQQVIVSTDDPDIAEVAERYEADVLMRPSYLAKNSIGTQAVMRHVMQELDHVEFACCLYATAPLIDPADFLRGWQVIHQPGYLYAMSVGHSPLRDIGAFYWGHAMAFREGTRLIDSHTAMIVIDELRCCDINTPEDWAQAERQYAHLHETEST